MTKRSAKLPKAPEPLKIDRRSKLQRRLDADAEDLLNARQIVPAVERSARLNRYYPSAQGLPTSTGPRYDDEAFTPPHDDPTGDAVVNARPTPEHDDVVALARWYGALTVFERATRALFNRSPAVAASVAKGFSPTNGRTADELAQAEFVHALAGSVCKITTDHETADRFGPGEIRSGMCLAHWAVWVEMGSPDVEVVVNLYGRRPTAEDEEAGLAETDKLDGVRRWLPVEASG